jgi:ribosomal protein L7/L12
MKMKLGIVEIKWLGFTFKSNWKKLLDKDPTQKITAIKMYWGSRGHNKIGLKEAKEHVELYINRHNA